MNPPVDGFVRACRALGATAPDGVLQRAAADLRMRWQSPGRGYHDLTHLQEVLDHLAELDAATSEPVLAAWFHDAVYEGHPGEDERASADLATSTLTRLGLHPAAVSRVRSLVLVTADHLPPLDDDAAAALCDADLAVLASPPVRYAAYVAGVRAEYGNLDDATFIRGRAAVLRGLVQRPALFRTAGGRQRWEADARANVATELRQLTGQDRV